MLIKTPPYFNTTTDLVIAAFNLDEKIDKEFSETNKTLCSLNAKRCPIIFGKASDNLLLPKPLYETIEFHGLFHLISPHTVDFVCL